MPRAVQPGMHVLCASLQPGAASRAAVLTSCAGRATLFPAACPPRAEKACRAHYASHRMMSMDATCWSPCMCIRCTFTSQVFISRVEDASQNQHRGCCKPSVLLWSARSAISFLLSKPMLSAITTSVLQQEQHIFGSALPHCFSPFFTKNPFTWQ